jgi:hypothetical protein
MPNEIERALHKWPETFRRELAALHDVAKNSGAVPPRRASGLAFSYGQVKAKYDRKIENLRQRGASQAVDDLDAAIAKIAVEFATALPTVAAA